MDNPYKGPRMYLAARPGAENKSRKFQKRAHEKRGRKRKMGTTLRKGVTKGRRSQQWQFKQPPPPPPVGGREQSEL